MNHINDSETVIFDFKTAIDEMQLPLIVTSANPEGMCFLIDTGSNHNILCDYVCEELKDQVRNLDEKKCLYGVDAKMQIVNRASLTLTICRQDYDADFDVVDIPAFDEMEKAYGVQLHGILGIDFLVRYRWTLDFASKQVVIPKIAA